MPEKVAIELKYAGHSYSDIAQVIDEKKSTVSGWFQKGGKLEVLHKEYCRKMNKSKDYYSLAEYVESDENVAKITTQVIRQFAKNLQADGKRVMEIDENGDPVKDSRGQKKIYDINLNIDVKDLERVWKMQRILTGRGTDGKNDQALEHEEDIEEMVAEAKRYLTAKPVEDEDGDYGEEDDINEDGEQ